MLKINRRNFRLAPKEDRAILLVCIGIALVFWLLVKLSQTYKAQRDVSFNVQTPSGKVLAKQPPKKLTVAVEGTGWDLLFDFFTKPELLLSYDMSGMERLNLSRGQIRSDIKQQLYSDDINIIDVNQDALTLLLEEENQATVPIRLRAQLGFAVEHQLLPPVQLSPDSVTLSGPKSVIASYTSWATDSISQTGLDKTQVRSIALEPAPPEVTLSTRQVEATIRVEPVTEKSVYVPLVVKNAPDSLRIFPDKVTLTFKVGLSKYDSVSYRDFTAEIDMKSTSPNAASNTIPIVITQQPGYIKSLYYRPKAAKYFIVESVKEQE